MLIKLEFKSGLPPQGGSFSYSFLITIGNLWSPDQTLVRILLSILFSLTLLIYSQKCQLFSVRVFVNFSSLILEIVDAIKTGLF